MVTLIFIWGVGEYIWIDILTYDPGGVDSMTIVAKYSIVGRAAILNFQMVSRPLQSVIPGCSNVLCSDGHLGKTRCPATWPLCSRCFSRSLCLFRTGYSVTFTDDLAEWT